MTKHHSTGIFAAAACVLLLCAVGGRAPATGPAETSETTSAVTESAAPPATGPAIAESMASRSASAAAEAPAAAHEARIPAISTTGTATTGPAAKKFPATKAEIVAFFNETANAVKRDRPGYTWTEQTTVGDIQMSSALLGAAARIFLPLVPQKPEAQPPVAPGADHGGFATRASHPWAAKLAPAMVQSARLTDRGDAWELFLAMEPETRPSMARYPEEHGHGHAFAVYETGSFMKDLEDYGSITLEKFAPAYAGSTVTYTIDKATGRPRRAVYDLRFTADIRAAVPVLGLIEGAAPIAVRREYVFAS